MERGSARASIGTSLYPSMGFWRLDSKALVGGVFFGIVMVLLVGAGDRADTALTGGAFLIFGGISWATIMGISTLLCRQPGGVIAGLMEGIVAIAAGISPLAVTFPIVNAAGSLAYSLVAWKLPMSSWGHHLLAQVAGNLVGNALVAVGLFAILQLPVGVILVSSGVTMVASIIGGTVVTKVVAETVARSGLLD
ncbi:MAG: hypothetical protein HY331_13185 [Chloroflexi bacterium]|nr:hypothetical protein [Chloroflexota bacterium]